MMSNPVYRWGVSSTFAAALEIFSLLLSVHPSKWFGGIDAGGTVDGFDVCMKSKTSSINGMPARAFETANFIFFFTFILCLSAGDLHLLCDVL